MDTITRQLRSQVCYSATVPALVSGTDDAVKFHVDLTDGTTPIQQRELVFNATTGRSPSARGPDRARRSPSRR